MQYTYLNRSKMQDRLEFCIICFTVQLWNHKTMHHLNNKHIYLYFVSRNIFETTRPDWCVVTYEEILSSSAGCHDNT